MVCAGNSNLAWSSSVIFQLQAQREKAEAPGTCRSAELGKVCHPVEDWGHYTYDYTMGWYNTVNSLVPRLLGHHERLPWGLRWQRICLQCRRPGFYPWVGKIPWRREWLPIPVFLPGKFHEQRSLTGYSPWGCKEWDMTERLTLSLFIWTKDFMVKWSWRNSGSNKVQLSLHFGTF